MLYEQSDESYKKELAKLDEDLEKKKAEQDK